MTGRMSTCGLAAGRPILLVPARLGVPDDGAGFVHLTGPPPTAPGEICDAHGAIVVPRYPLGDGWWWAD